MSDEPVQVSECRCRVALVLGEIDKVKKCAHCLHGSCSETGVTGNDSEKHPFEVLRFFPSVLPKASETISKMTKADSRLQDRQLTVKFSISKPFLGPFDRVVHEKLVPFIRKKIDQLELLGLSI